MKSLLIVLSMVFQFNLNALANNDVEKIIGADDFILVNAELSNLPFKLRKAALAVGMLTDGCTVTHIGQGYAITAGHCFWAGPEEVKKQKCDGDEYVIEWGVISGRKPYLKSKCKEILTYQQGDFKDYALIKVDPAPEYRISIDLNTKAKIGDRMTILSHPDLAPLTWSKMCDVDRQFSSEFSLDYIHHSCDSLPGSSGAALINPDTLKIIGIHDGGRAYDGVGKNYGTPILNTPIPEVLRKLNYKQ